MKKLTKFISLALGALMMLGVGVGIKPMMKEADAANWTRVTSIAELTAGGTFIIGYEATAKSGVIIPLRSADCNATTSANGYFHTGTATGSSSNGTINMSTVTATADYEVYIAGVSGSSNTVTIQRANKDGNYYGSTSGGSSKNTARLYTSPASETNIVIAFSNETNNQFKMSANVSGQYKYLKYNTGSPRYAFYNSEGSNNVFYKKGSSSDSTVAISRFYAENTTLCKGESELLTAEVTNAPSGSTLVWSSSDESVISLIVDSEDPLKATITSLKNGSSTITASLKDASAETTYVSTTLSLNCQAYEEFSVDNLIYFDNTILPSNYSSRNICTKDGLSYYASKVINNSNSSLFNKDGGLLFNLNAFNKNIYSIHLTLKDGSTQLPNIYPKNGFSSGTVDAIVPTSSGNVYVYSFSSLNSKYFSISNDGNDNACYISSLSIYFNARYCIFFNLNGGLLDSSFSFDSSPFDGETFTFPTLSQISKTGYNLVNFVDENDNTYGPGQTIIIHSNYSFTAIWEVGELMETTKTFMKLGFVYEYLAGNPTTTSMVKSSATSGSIYLNESNKAQNALNLGFNSSISIYSIKNSASYQPNYSNNKKYISMPLNSALVIECSSKITNLRIGYGSSAGILTCTDSNDTVISGSAVTGVNYTYDYIVNDTVATLTAYPNNGEIKTISVTYGGAQASFSNMNLFVTGTISGDAWSQHESSNLKVTSAGVLINKAGSISPSIVQGMTYDSLNSLSKTEFAKIPVPLTKVKTDGDNKIVEGFITNIPESSWKQVLTTTIYIIVDGKCYFGTPKTHSVQSITNYYVANSYELGLTDKEKNVVIELQQYISKLA